MSARNDSLKRIRRPSALSPQSKRRTLKRKFKPAVRKPSCEMPARKHGKVPWEIA
jgi:hypothetical protein